ncbi:hypothetical protein LJB42_002906 [Komagataella kurtzmanii]|nr:hypothetical protein LJB42_002906 [Komagataella kurtzmanii]
MKTEPTGNGGLAGLSAIKLPTSFPLVPEAQQELSKINLYDTQFRSMVSRYTDQLEQTASKFISNKLEMEALQLIDDPLEKVRESIQKDCKNLIDEFTSSGRKITEEELERSRYQVALTAIKAQKRINYRESAEVSLDNLDVLRDQREEISCADQLESQLSTLEVDSATFETANNRLQLLQEHLFVTLNPESELPDAEDDDVAISGGKVSLICPISKRPMKNPVKITVCGHCFERTHILEFLQQSQGSGFCPECRTLFKKQDLVDDDLMKLRLEAHNRDLLILQYREKKSSQIGKKENGT